MVNLITKAISRIVSLFQTIQVKQFLVAVCMGVLLLTTSTPSQRQNQAVTREIDRVAQQDDVQRPRTGGEWKQEARATEGEPGERLNRIAKETGDALKDWGEMYSDVAKRSVDELENNVRN